MTQEHCVRPEHWTVFGEVTGMLFLVCAGESAGLWDVGVGGNELLMLWCYRIKSFPGTCVNFNQLCILTESGLNMH